MRRMTLVAVIVCGIVGFTAVVAVGLAPTFDSVHEHDVHEDPLQDMAYDDANDIVWSIDEAGMLVGYDVAEEQVVVEEDLDVGHAIAVGEDATYVASGDHLLEVDIHEGEITTLQDSLEAHPSRMAFDGERDLLWMAGAEEVHAYDLEGNLDRSIAPGDGHPHIIDVNEEYVAWSTGFDDEVIVWDIEDESVAFEPTFPDEYEASMTVGVALTDDNELIVGTDGDGSMVAMFDIESESVVTEYREHIFSVNEVAYHAEADAIISGGADNHLTAYDVAAESVIEQHDHGDTILAMALDESNELLWVGDGEETDPTVTGLSLGVEETPTPEATPPSEPTPTPIDDPDDTPTPDTPADETPTPIVHDTPTPDPDDQPGFGLAMAALAVLALAAVASRRR